MSTNALAGRSVRNKSLRIYRDAGSKAFWAAVLVASAIATAARGAQDVSVLLAGAGMILARRAWQLRGDAKRYWLGAVAEERVGARLEALGWVVEHDIAKRGGGNVDHVVHSSSVTFTIDTKRSRWHGQDLGQAHRHAEWAARHYGGLLPIVPVICIQRSSRPVSMVDGVYIVGAGRLVDFLIDRG